MSKRSLKLANKSQREIDFLNGKDSKDEVYIEWYLQELKDAGIIADYWYHPDQYMLASATTKTELKQTRKGNKEKITSFKRAKTYTPDYRIIWNNHQMLRCYDFVAENTITCNLDGYFYAKKMVSNIDIKPIFAKRDSDTAKFSLIQTIMLDTHKVYVQDIVYQDLFAATFTPKRFLLTDSGNKERKINFNVRSLQEFLTFDKF